MIIRYTETKFQKLLLSIKQDIHVQKMLVKKQILPDSHTILHRVISIMFISIDRVFNWLLDYIS